MKFQTETLDHCDIIALSGNLLSEADDKEILEHISQRVKNGQSQFVIDLGSIEYVNSTGLGTLIRMLARARNSGGEVVLANITKQLSRLLVITKLNNVFHVFKDVKAATGHFKA